MGKLAEQARRDFLKQTVSAGAVATIAPGVFLSTVAQAEPRAEAVSDKVRWGMLIDTTKCASGCTDCVSACR